MELTDPYSQAKATLRENVRWLATCFSGAVAVVLAGTPFVGFGALEIGSEPFRLAVGALVAGTAALLIAIAYIFYMLRPDAIYPDYVREAEVVGGGILERREIAALRKEFAQRKRVMLPKDIASVDKLETEIEDLWAAARGDVNTAQGQQWMHYRVNLYNIYAWASFSRFHRRVRRGVVVVGLLALFALACLASFAWSVVPKKPSEPERGLSVVNVTRAPDPVPALSVMRSIHFATGKSKLSADGLRTLEQVRADVRARPRSVVLLYAYTDTVGSAATNGRLARDRMQEVVRALVVPGGVARAQILAVELPETSLPAITPEERPEQRNRAVDLVVTELPQAVDESQAAKR